MAEQNLLSAAAQLSSLGQGYGDLLTSTASSAMSSIGPGIPLPDHVSSIPMSSSFSGFGRFGQQPCFTSPNAPNTTGMVFSHPPTMSVPSTGLPKGLNPNAPDFNRGGMYNHRGNIARPQGMPQQKMSHQHYG